jgi:hypothetical protein
MAKKKSVHVVKNGNRWAVKEGGTSAPKSNHNTQANAIEAARRVAQRQETELRIHGLDGRIRETRSYGNDPHPPKDRA